MLFGWMLIKKIKTQKTSCSKIGLIQMTRLQQKKEKRTKPIFVLVLM